jgi:deoxyribodipyrimidine photo-lyase
MTAHVSLVWVRHDLRVADTPALDAAVTCGGVVLPVYIWAPEEEGEWSIVDHRASRVRALAAWAE